MIASLVLAVACVVLGISLGLQIYTVRLNRATRRLNETLAAYQRGKASIGDVKTAQDEVRRCQGKWETK